ncbi:MAG: hypothetical protein J1F39_01010 [Clostridiales bacterium]|nr:hypothetical protein [Clostridiales bacterium]
MTEQQKRLVRIVLQAIESFNLCEDYLISHDLSERCICSKFAQYLDREIQSSEFVGYKTDIEYNRGCAGNEYALKRMDDGKLMVADLIVHKRGYDANYGFDNLICIEMKKCSKESKLRSDLERLKKMTTNDYGFCYKIGLMLVANACDGKLEIYKKFYNEHC